MFLFWHLILCGSLSEHVFFLLHTAVSTNTHWIFSSNMGTYMTCLPTVTLSVLLVSFLLSCMFCCNMFLLFSFDTFFFGCSYLMSHFGSHVTHYVKRPKSGWRKDPRGVLLTSYEHDDGDRVRCGVVRKANGNDAAESDVTQRGPSNGTFPV